MPTKRGMTRSVCDNAFVIAGLDPASHHRREISSEEDGPSELGFTRVRTFMCASRINPTCVVKPAGDSGRRGATYGPKKRRYRPRGRQPPRIPARPEVERGPGR